MNIEKKPEARINEPDEYEEKFRLTAEKTTDLIASVDSMGFITYASPASLNIFKISPDEMCGTHFTEFLDESSIPAAISAFKTAVETNSGTEVLELTMKRKDGSLFLGELRGSPMMSDTINSQLVIIRDISDIKKAQEELKLKSLLLDQIGDQVTITDLEGNITYINQAQEKTLKRTGEELIGKPTQVYGENEKQGSTQKEIIETTLRDGKWSGKVINYASDGTELIIECKTLIIYDLKGNQIALGGVGKDITDSHKAEIELKLKSEAIETSIDGIAILDSKGNYLYLNNAHAEIYGYDNSDELKGKNWRTLYSKKELDRFSKIILPELFKKRKWKGEAVGTKKDRSVFDQEISLTALEDNGIICIVRDITKRKKMEKRERENEERNLAILNAIPDMVFMFNSDGIFLDYHAPEDAMLLVKPEDFFGRNIYDFFPENIADMTIFHIKEILSSGKTEPYTYSLTFGDETSFFESRMVPCGKDNFLAIVHDITELKSAEKEKEKLQTQLIQSQKMEAVGRLAGGVAHDFNNMLSIILGHSEMLLENIEKTDPFYNSLKEIKNAANRSADLTKQLLAFARKQTVTPKPADINKAVEKMLKMLRRLIGEDIDLIWQPDKYPGIIMIDKSQFDQIMINLCVNARDSITSDGKITIKTEKKVLTAEDCMSMQGAVPGSYIMLSVSDNGSGMSIETISNLFEPFFTTKERGKGTGLGLSTVYGIIKQNKGYIDVKSIPEKGSEFRLYLPECSNKTPELSSEHKENIRHSNAVILLVEDEPEILEITQLMLEHSGYTVVHAGSPEAAVKKAEELHSRIDILLTDVVMPGMNGKELEEKIAVIHPELKSLFMSGYTADIIAPHGIIEKNMNFIQKPFSIKDLTQKINSILNQNQQSLYKRKT